MFSVKDVNLEKVGDVQSWYKNWLLNDCNHIQA